MKVLLSWKERIPEGWFVERFTEFDDIDAALDFARFQLQRGVAVHVQPI